MAITRRKCLFLFSAGLSAAPASKLSAEWSRISAGTDGWIGAAALHLVSGEHLSLHGGDAFPMASVCKLPIAMQILAMVDERKLSRQTMIAVRRQDVSLNVSEVGQRWPKQARYPLDELLELMVARSDNTAVETLYRIGGGSAALMARLRAWQVDGIRIDRSERECNRDSSGPTPAARLTAMRSFISDPRDTASPDGTVRLLQLLFAGKLLSASSTARLVEILETTRTGPERIKGLLPPGIVVAHKTGTTGTASGLNAATNDVGVITLPAGAGKFALAVYVKGSTQDLAARERVIARIARAAFDFWRSSS